MRYELKLKKWAQRREAIRALYAQGNSWNAIGRRYKITGQRAQQIGKKQEK